MSTPTIRDHCATLAGDVLYLLACIRDGSSDSYALQQCLDHANTARDALKAEPVGEGPILQWTDNTPPCEECRYDHCNEQVRLACFDPTLGEPWPDDHQAAFAAGVAAERDRLKVDSENWGSEALNAATRAMTEAYRRHTGQPETLIFYNNAKAILRDALGAYFNKGPTQRNSSNGGPAIPKPPIKPCPTGGRLITNNKPPKES